MCCLWSLATRTANCPGSERANLWCCYPQLRHCAKQLAHLLRPGFLRLYACFTTHLAGLVDTWIRSVLISQIKRRWVIYVLFWCVYLYTYMYLFTYAYILTYSHLYIISSVPTSRKQQSPDPLEITCNACFKDSHWSRSLCSSHGRGKVGRSLVLPSGLFLVLFSSGCVFLNLHMRSI